MIAKSALFLSVALSIFLAHSATCNHELLGHWTFEKGEELKDLSNNFGSIKLNRGAFIRDGVLNTNGIGWAVAGSYKGSLITEKTLVSWVAFNDFEYQEGSVLTIDRITTDEFDGIVLGESQKWLSGSSYHRRTEDPSPGYTETMPNTLIQIAITYEIDGNGKHVVHLYRNGESIGSYSKGSIAMWRKNDAEVFWGIRHGSSTKGGPGTLNVKIEESRIYNGALSATDLKKLTPIKKYVLLGQFTFEEGEEMKDRMGNFGNVVLRGATIANGRLDLGPGKWAASPSYTGPTIYEKTLVSWVSIDSLNTQRGSVLTIDKKSKDQFDAIVLGERQRNYWMAGSSFFRRTLDVKPGFKETEVNKMFQIAITYEKAVNGQAHIKLYRNGEKFGDYTRGPLVNWPAGDAELFWGIRTGSLSRGGPDAVDAHIEESRIYAGVLNEFDLKSLTPIKDYALLGQFTFEEGEEMKDRMGNFGNVVLRGATIANGRLDLGPGKWAASPSYTGPTIYEKTLVSWVSIDSLNTQRGSVLTIDKKSKDQFDAIVLGERQRNYWMAGSSFFRRTLDVKPGFKETEVNKMFQIAITYEKAVNGQAHIKLYRNGEKFGDYTRGPLVNWPAGDAELFWGIRTGSLSRGGPDAVDAHIEESRIYAGVLNEFDLKSLTPIKDYALLGQFTFEEGEEMKDRMGNFGNVVLRGATIANGRLDLGPGKWAASPSYTGPTIYEKTLVSWVSIDSLNTQSGSVLTIDKKSKDQFDAIVLGERQRNYWMAGSSFFRRTLDVKPGFKETEVNKMFQIAITYEKAVNGQAHIKLYRNGEKFGDYTRGPLVNWPAGDAELFWGIRTGSLSRGGPDAVDAHIEESRIYAGVLNEFDLKSLTPIKDYALLGQFTFEEGEEMKDRMGNFGNVVLRGATIANGRLDLGPGKWAASPSYTGPTIYEKTLVSWVSIDSLNTQSGSVLTIDKKSKDQFDAIVLGERQRNYWMAGSSFFRRTLDVKPGFKETEVNKMFQIAITYEKAVNGQAHIKLYRNGEKFGDYTRGPLVNWPAGDAELFWGIRTGSLSRGGPDAVDAHIEESRIYAGVLNEFDLKSLTPLKAANCEAEEVDEVSLSNEMMESSDEETNTEQETAGNAYEFKDDYGMPLYAEK